MNQKQFNPIPYSNRLRNSIAIHDKIISIRNVKEFAILERSPSLEGLTGITFSIPITHSDADIINQSGIATVESHTASGTLVFTRKCFYDNYKMIDLILDILMRYETAQKEPSQHLA